MAFQPTKTRIRRTCLSFILLAPIISLFSACNGVNSHPSAMKLIGNWELIPGDSESLESGAIDEATAKRLAREAKRLDRDVLAGDRMTVTFLPQGVLETDAKQKKKGTWRFKSYDESRSELSLECRLGSEELVGTKVRFVTDDIISMIPPNIAVLEKEFVFQRTE